MRERGEIVLVAGAEEAAMEGAKGEAAARPPLTQASSTSRACVGGPGGAKIFPGGAGGAAEAGRGTGHPSHIHRPGAARALQRVGRRTA